MLPAINSNMLPSSGSNMLPAINSNMLPGSMDYNNVLNDIYIGPPDF